MTRWTVLLLTCVSMALAYLCAWCLQPYPISVRALGAALAGGAGASGVLLLAKAAKGVQDKSDS